jgi:hypothetical protein
LFIIVPSFFLRGVPVLFPLGLLGKLVLDLVVLHAQQVDASAQGPLDVLVLERLPGQDPFLSPARVKGGLQPVDQVAIALDEGRSLGGDIGRALHPRH